MKTRRNVVAVVLYGIRDGICLSCLLGRCRDVKVAQQLRQQPGRRGNTQKRDVWLVHKTLC